MGSADDKTVLILTHNIDPTADFVAHEFNRRGVPFIRMDLGEFPATLSVSARIDSASDDWTGRFERPSRPVDLGHVRSVWWRRPTSFQFPEHLSREERWFSRDESASAFGGLLRLQDALWVNDPESGLRAEFKPIQLKTARQCGMDIPRTLITSVAQEARDFIQENRSIGLRTIYKTLAYTDVVNPVSADSEVIYTTLVTEDDLDEELIRVAPCLFQAEVPKDVELRITVVGSQIFTAAIDSAGTDAGKVDFRMAYEELTYAEIELPELVVKQVMSIMRSLNLTFGALDIIRRPDGGYVFLEINPSGQWAWLEAEIGLPITAALCDTLERTSSQVRS